MKLIDLLNKIANNEELPKKIYFYDDLFELHQVEQYGEIYTDYKCVNEGTMLFKDEIIKITMLLNEEVVVVDFGMNIGVASLFFATKEKVKAVYGYEAFPDTYQQALDNFAMNETVINKIHPYNFAITMEEGDRDIVVSHTSTASRNIYSTDESKTKVKLICKSAKSVLKEVADTYPNTKLLIKCDTEGAEFDIFQSIGETDLLNRVDAIIMEYHNSPETILELLDGYGFRYWRMGQEQLGMIVAFKTH